MVIPFLPNVKNIAIVGASRNPNKWRYLILKRLILINGLKIYPVNPKADYILGLRAYKTVKELPEVPDMIITVVPPSITESVVREAIELGVKIIWMQPGSDNKEIAEYARREGAIVHLNRCILRLLERGYIS